MSYVHTVDYINPTQDDCKGQLFPWRLLRYAEFDTQHPANATVPYVPSKLARGGNQAVSKWLGKQRKLKEL